MIFRNDEGMKKPKKLFLWRVHVIKYLSTSNVLEATFGALIVFLEGIEHSCENFISFYYYDLGQINFLSLPVSPSWRAGS
jgi:hypothetical protein